MILFIMANVGLCDGDRLQRLFLREEMRELELGRAALAAVQERFCEVLVLL